MLRHEFLISASLVFLLALPNSAFGQLKRENQKSYTMHIVTLQTGSAAEAAAVIDEAFNGLGSTRKTRILIFAVPGTKSVFVMGESLDVLTVRELLKSA